MRSQHSEEGSLGLAFSPDFAENGYFFVYYTADGPTEDGPTRSVLSRFSASTPDSNVAEQDSELVILEQEQPFGNHNGGMIAFGPDGYLYVALGDGGDAGGPRPGRQQSESWDLPRRNPPH